MSESLRRLKALAQKATPGPWELVDSCGLLEVWTEESKTVIHGCKEEDSAYLAALDPSIVLRLIAELVELTKDLVEAREHHRVWFVAAEGYRVALEAARKKLKENG